MKKLKYKNKFIVNTRTTWPKSLKWSGKLPVLSMKYKQDNNFDVIFDLENKLIQANKRAKKWRKEAKTWEKMYKFDLPVETNMHNFYAKLYRETNLKQKKAWIAWYIATIFYIVGIIILI